MSKSIPRKARIFLNRVETLVANNTPPNVEKTIVISDVLPHEQDGIMDIIENKHQDECGFYLTRLPKYDKHSYELVLHGMFHEGARCAPSNEKYGDSDGYD